MADQTRAEGVPAALHAAVAAIYFDDSADYIRALWSVVRALDPEVAEVLESDEEVAYWVTNPRAPDGDVDAATVKKVRDFRAERAPSPEAPGEARYRVTPPSEVEPWTTITRTRGAPAPEAPGEVGAPRSGEGEVGGEPCLPGLEPASLEAVVRGHIESFAKWAERKHDPESVTPDLKAALYRQCITHAQLLAGDAGDLLRALAARAREGDEWERKARALETGMLGAAEREVQATREAAELRAELEGTRKAASYARREIEKLERDHEDLWEERTRTREALFLFASVIRSGEPWTEHCEAALAKATAPLGHHRSTDAPRAAEPGGGADA